MIHLICGKICSGKTWYARELACREHGVILSTDELTWDLTNNEQGPGYDAFARRCNRYLRKKAGQIAATGCSVILDWGFWTKSDRREISEYFANLGLSVCWHYMDVPEDVWQENIRRRNGRIQKGQGGSDFFVDEGLKNKVLTLFEIPEREEMDIWYVPQYEKTTS
jgi:predicted kinase